MSWVCYIIHSYHAGILIKPNIPLVRLDLLFFYIIPVTATRLGNGRELQWRGKELEVGEEVFLTVIMATSKNTKLLF